MKILVTGGAGFIGSHVVEAYQGKAEVVVLDNLRTGNLEHLKGLDYTWIEGSICDSVIVEQAVQSVEVVYHLAAFVSVPESMELPQACVDINVSGLLNVLNASRAANVKKLVFASSAAVYGASEEVPKIESMQPAPLSPYAITKLDGEYYCEMWRREGWLDTTCLRFFNVFGERQDPNSAYAAAVPIFIANAKSNIAIKIFGNGSQTRDFIYVKDIVSALVFVAANPTADSVYNVGYGGRISIRDLATAICELTKSSGELVYMPKRAGDVMHSCASADKLKSLGWVPEFGFEQGITRTIQLSS